VIFRGYLRLVDLLPLPSLGVQRFIAIAVILTQAGIAVTGAVVRVTASGLGCPTWPQCFPGSFTPVGVSEVPVLHQIVEFGNRTLTSVVVLCAAAIVLAVTRARRHREVVLWAWLMPAGTVLQAILGGVTVLTGLLWWTVAVHLLASMLMVWLAVLLYTKVAQPDDVTASAAATPAALRWLTALSAAVMSTVLVAGTLVTGAGPHAGDKNSSRTVPRLRIEIVTLVHAHAQLLVAYLALLVGLAFSLYAVGAARRLRRRLWIVLAMVVAQAGIGVTQYLLDVPAALVAIHVGGAAACVAATAALWAELNRPQDPAPADA
jgi:cytochrome c oxidase assembly protein subunit 15